MFFHIQHRMPGNFLGIFVFKKCCEQMFESYALKNKQISCILTFALNISIMHLRNDELTLLYNANNARDRQTLAMALAITPKINRQEVNSVNISATLFKVMIDRLEIDPKRLLNKADVEYQRLYRGSEYDAETWLRTIVNRPQLLRAPVAMFRGSAMICDTPTSIFRLVSPKPNAQA